MIRKRYKAEEFNGKTITFYSYKGGVGRTMSLINIACLMKKQAKKVLLIDWDLEAPGLHSYFEESSKKEKGLVELITNVKRFFSNADKNNEENGYNRYLNLKLKEYISYDLKLKDHDLGIDFIRAGKFDDGYIDRLNAIDWMGFYKNSPAFFRTFAGYLESRYDYILIDSRTGLADTSGICAMLMPQILVLVFALNEQNLDGVLRIAKQSIEYRFRSLDYRDLTILPLPSRIDKENSEELAKWIEKYRQRFEDLFKESYLLDKDECNLANYFNLAKIEYKPMYAYGEKIPVLEEKEFTNDLFISYHYMQFFKLIEMEEPIWGILTDEQTETIKRAKEFLENGKNFYNQRNFRNSCAEFEKACELYPAIDIDFFQWGNALFQLAELQEDMKFFNQSLEKYTEGEKTGKWKKSQYYDPNIVQAMTIPTEIKQQ
jgi:cellulose biosynthesis protein BcsQ